MLKNYLKIAWRNLVRQKAFSLINVQGLSVGLACCLILLAFVKHEKSYDAFHPDSDQVYRVVQEVQKNNSWAWAGGAVAPMLRKEFEGELDEVVSLTQISTYLKAPDGIAPDESFREDHFIFTDEGFDRIFGFELSKGSWKGVLENPYQVVITEEMATKYFGDADPIGKALISTGDFSFEVRGVLKKLPSNTHMDFDFVSGMNTFKSFNDFPTSADFGSFWWPQTYTYVKVNKQQDPAAISKKIPEINPKYRNPEEAKSYVHFLQPITDVHTNAGFQGDWTPPMSLQTLWIFLSIGVFVLFLACINFINLATARAIKRMKEIGIRKVNGAQRTQLIFQFLAESFLINAVSMIIGLIFVYISVPLIESSISLKIPIDLFGDTQLQVLLFGIWIGSSVLAGVFPAFYLSGLKPEMILKQSPLSKGKSVLRKTLVVFQFVLSTLLVFCASVAFYQHQFMTDASMGFDSEGLISVKMGSLAKEKGDVLKQELGNVPGVSSVKFTSDRPGVDTGWNPPADFPGMKEGESRNINVQYVDADFFETLNIPILSGREFIEDGADRGTSELMRGRFPDLSNVAMIVNESAVEWMGKDLNSVLGSDLRVFTEENGELFSNYKGIIVGVVKDYHTRDLRYTIEPTVYLPAKNAAFDGTQYILIKADQGINSELLESLKSTWKEVNEGLPFDYNFLDEDIAMQYAQQAKTSSLLGSFAFLTLLISCLGLLGLSIFTAESRRKEIGIRRVLGASAASIANKLTSEFLILVMFSLLIALPLGYYLMQEWLDQFAFKVPISIWFFLISAAISVILAYSTVSIQSLKTALANPVDAIKNE
ncbi:putative ABC transport system permease protein [Algoriphagus iocasae]|jgi:putative ABC transport system permease protein|uniref:Putative ABC transport system permease protein n=1 Tax=Algoriphagus iocasae TaxID=1836499 RepID=A0A841MJH8_9BACT|nr:ABC transporter permease [Algoriphagus iocasae]MBB6327550.1 putative ABC transport system permease protein [Algoriphagus iocasae]